tara:strand:+ start:15623 stop:15871 length:249 start_codon:yes stop_codon:yes gene_type:complete
MSNRENKRYMKKMMEKTKNKKNVTIQKTIQNEESYIIDAKKLTTIESIQKAFELIHVRFNPPNEEAYKEYESILSKEEEILK